MAEFASNGQQTVNPGESVVFNLAPVPCARGLINPRLGSGNILLRGWLPNSLTCGCNCNRNLVAIYRVTFGANIAIPEGGTASSISLPLQKWLTQVSLQCHHRQEQLTGCSASLQHSNNSLTYAGVVIYQRSFLYIQL